jgi:glycerophosphoryl diester phosphodiesterase
MASGVALAVPAQAVRPGGPPDPDRSVVLPRVVARATSTGDQPSGAPSASPARPDDGRHRETAEDPAVAGFSAAVANDDGTFWALPDGDASQNAPQVPDPEVEEAGDGLVRIALIRPRWERAGGGRGSVQILRHLTVADPYRNLPFPITNEDTRTRRLTGADLDVESLQRMPDGTFWIGEERGPYLIHVDRRGRVLSPPVPFPLGGSPLNPGLGSDSAATQASGGFEATAMSQNGRYLYPILERALVKEGDGRRRVVS